MNKMNKSVPKLNKHTELLCEIAATKAKRAVMCPIAIREHKPLLPMKNIVQMIIDQREFLEREILTHHLLECYAFNTTDLLIVMGKDLQEAIAFDEKYVDECMSDLADFIQRGKVYKVPNGIFTGWGAKKSKHTKGILTVSEAIEDCQGLKYGTL